MTNKKEPGVWDKGLAILFFLGNIFGWKWQLFDCWEKFLNVLQLLASIAFDGFCIETMDCCIVAFQTAWFVLRFIVRYDLSACFKQTFQLHSIAMLNSSCIQGFHHHTNSHCVFHHPKWWTLSVNAELEVGKIQSPVVSLIAIPMNPRWAAQ